MRKRDPILIAVLSVFLVVSARTVTFTADGTTSVDEQCTPDTSRRRPSPSSPTT